MARTSTSNEGIAAFVRYLTLGEDRRTGTKRRELIPDAARVVFDVHGRELYSYGRHFPLARFVPAKRGRSALWLINGDIWRGGGWSLTSRHQRETREAIADAIADAAKIGRRVSSVVIPFSALDGAGITRDSVRPVHVRADRNETFTNRATIARRYADVPLPSFADAEARSRETDARGTAVHVTDTLAPALKLAVTRVSDMSGESDTYALTAKLTRAVCFRGYDHSVTNESGGRGAYVDYSPPRVNLWINGGGDAKIIDTGGDTVTLEWSTSRHWLGDALFTAERVTSRRVPCEAHEPTADAPTWCDHCGHSLTSPGWITRETRKRSRFVSSFDYNERAPLYFLAALPSTSRAKTVEMAIEDLAPASVHAAYARGLAVKRQGDIFAIPTPLTDAEVYARAVRRSRLYMHTHPNGKPRAGEVGYRVPLAPAAKIRAAQVLRETFRAAMREHLAGDAKRPVTPKGWHAAKRAELHALRLEMARHERRIADGAEVCGYGCEGYRDRHATQTGEACGTCGRPRWYDRYTVDNAESALARARERYAAKLAEPRHVKRDHGYAAAPTRRYNAPDGANLTDGNRARAAYARAVASTAERFTPPLPWQDIRDTLAIHGTGHTATEVAVCAGGVTYVRGTMRHVPAIAGERRGSDHAALALDGARWYLAVRNTVPRQ